MLLMLARAHQSNGELDISEKMYISIASNPQVEMQAKYNLGINYALGKQLDNAFKTLGEVKASGQINLTQMDLDPRTTNLREDARYRSLFPSQQQYDNPFVESTRIIQDWQGEAVGDVFGWVARNVGDVDGDGISDVGTSAPFNSEGGQGAGKIYVYSSASGKLLWSTTGNAGDALGLCIEASGDFNQDGIPDVISGAPNAGKAMVYSGNDGKILFTFSSDQDGSAYGRQAKTIGDINDDGIDDIIIGAPTDSTKAPGAGAAFIYSGKSGKELLQLYGESAGDNFGRTVAGRKNGKGYFAIGAPNSGEGNRGQTYVYEGLSANPKFVIKSDDKGAQLGGMFISIVGDFNNDDEPDIYASDWSHNELGPSTGRVYVHSGKDGSLLFTKSGEAAGDGFGIGIADAGDINDDGYDDLVIGSWQHSAISPSGGKVYVYSGRDGSLMTTYSGNVPGETFGFDATGLGDVDGDGIIDFLVTSAYSGINGSRSGRTLIISGKMD